MRTKALLRYFEGLAEKHLGHSPEESHFFRPHQTATASPYLSVERISFGLQGKADNLSKQSQLSFVVLSHLSETDNDQAIDQIFDDTEEKIHQIICTMVDDHRKRIQPMTGLDVQSISAQPIGMENDQDFGWEVKLTFIHKFYDTNN